MVILGAAPDGGRGWGPPTRRAPKGRRGAHRALLKVARSSTPPTPRASVFRAPPCGPDRRMPPEQVVHETGHHVAPRAQRRDGDHRAVADIRKRSPPRCVPRGRTSQPTAIRRRPACAGPRSTTAPGRCRSSLRSHSSRRTSPNSTTARSGRTDEVLPTSSPPARHWWLASGRVRGARMRCSPATSVGSCSRRPREQEVTWTAAVTEGHRRPPAA